MRLNVVLTDEQNEAISERAEAEGISRAEWIRRSLDSYLEPDMSLPGAEEIAALATVTAERDHAIEVLARLTTENDRMREQISTLIGEGDRLKTEVAARDQVNGERADEIRWLRGEVSKLNDKLTPAALPEKAGTGRRPWWRWWE